MACFVLGPEKVLSFDVGYGTFGWMADPDTRWFLLTFVAPVNGIMSNLSFFVSYYFFPMEIIAGALLTQPFISQVVGILMGQDTMPGFRTIFGLILVTIGAFVSSYGARMKAVEKVEGIIQEEGLASKISFTELKVIKEEDEEEH